LAKFTKKPSPTFAGKGLVLEEVIYNEYMYHKTSMKPLCVIHSVSLF